MPENKIKYESKEAGYVMISTEHVPSIDESLKISDVRDLVTTRIREYATINYIYIVSKTNKLRGVISIKELFRAEKKSEEIKKLMVKGKDVISIRATTSQEKIAIIAVKNSLKAVPVVDKDNKFLGVVPSDTVLEIMNNEALEDYLKLGGLFGMTGFDSIEEVSLWKSIKYRLPWLFLGLLGGLFITKIIGYFNVILSENILFAAFMPLVVYMGSAVGTQTQALMIRDLSFANKFNFLNIFIKQISVVSSIGFILASTFYIISIFLCPDRLVCFTLSVALFTTVFSSVFTGLFVPYFFHKIKMDPAHASGPIATIVQDTLSVLVYFSVITAML